MCSSPHLWFCACKTATLAYELLVSFGPNPRLCFLHAEQRLVDQHTSLYGYQTSPVVLCMYKNVHSIGNTSLYWCQPSSVLFYFKTASFASEKRISLRPRPHLSFCAWKTAWLASESLVSMGPSPYLWLLHANQRLLEQNYKSIGEPALFCGLCMQNSALWTSIQVPMCTRPHLSFCAYKPGD